MKRTLHFLSLFAIIFPLFQSLTFAVEDKGDWVSCKNDNECVVVPTSCGRWQSINKNKLSEARPSFDREHELRECGGKYVYAEIFDPKCINSKCSPKDFFPVSKSPSKKMIDWAVKTLIERTNNLPIQDPEKLIPAALEVVFSFPSQVVVEKTLTDNAGKTHKNVQHRIPVLCLDIYFVGGVISRATRTPDCISEQQILSFLKLVKDLGTSNPNGIIYSGARETFSKGALLPDNYEKLFSTYEARRSKDVINYSFLHIAERCRQFWVRLSVNAKDKTVNTFDAMGTVTNCQPTNPSPVRYVMRIKTNTDGSWTYILGNRDFRTLTEMKSYIKTLPSGTKIEWTRSDDLIEGAPLQSKQDIESFKRYCEDNRIILTIYE